MEQDKKSDPQAVAKQPQVVLEQPGGEMSMGRDSEARPPPRPEDVRMGLPCAQCSELYPLPRGATTWRCRRCGHFNSTGDDPPFVLCSIS
mmetsp:Transcript_29010/g.78032  ORF Transcript_29010/g.78032 Transcript_29010/m.78032 type:complete len:90 (-) Transcript_29010:962-1231(-)